MSSNFTLKYILFESEYHGKIFLDIISVIFLIAFFIGGICFTVYALSYEDSAKNIYHSNYQEEKKWAKKKQHLNQ